MASLRTRRCSRSCERSIGRSRKTLRLLGHVGDAAARGSQRRRARRNADGRSAGRCGDLSLGPGRRGRGDRLSLSERPRRAVRIRVHGNRRKHRRALVGDALARGTGATGRPGNEPARDGAASHATPRRVSLVRNVRRGPGGNLSDRRRRRVELRVAAVFHRHAGYRRSRRPQRFPGAQLSRPDTSFLRRQSGRIHRLLRPKTRQHETFAIEGDANAAMRLRAKARAKEARRAVRYRTFDNRAKIRRLADATTAAQAGRTSTRRTTQSRKSSGGSNLVKV